MPDEAALISKAAYARHRGVGKSAVSNWIKRGQIVLVGDKVDQAASDTRLAALVDPAGGRDAGGAQLAKAPPSRSKAPRSKAEKAAAGPEPGSVSVADETAASLAEERLGEIRERRFGQALKNAQMAGELVPVEAFEARLQTLIGGFCERLQSELRAQSEALAKETERRTVRGMLDDIVSGVRSDFAERILAASSTEETDGDEEGEE